MGVFREAIAQKITQLSPSLTQKPGTALQQEQGKKRVSRVSPITFGVIVSRILFLILRRNLRNERHERLNDETVHSTRRPPAPRRRASLQLDVHRRSVARVVIG